MDQTLARKTRTKPIAIARAQVQRADGSRETHYSYEPVPIWRFRRWLKLHKHLRFMKAEDKATGWA